MPKEKLSDNLHNYKQGGPKFDEKLFDITR